ncbi:MAG: hypothetical protein IIC20_04910 [Chloroflexi bacterium]|nr:hypothetical protein [Chloroflexota bacterium]
MLRTAILSSLIALLPALAIAAPCAERAKFLAYFDDKFDEAPVSMGHAVLPFSFDRGPWAGGILPFRAHGPHL